MNNVVRLINPDAGAPAPVSSYPSEWIGFLEKGVTGLLDAKKYDEAFQIIRIALALAPNNPAPHIWAGVSLRGDGELEGAEMAFRRALEIDPGNSVAMANLGGLLYDGDTADEAIRLLETALAKDPSSDFIVQNLMVALLSAGKLERGWNLYARRQRFPAVGNQICRYPVPWWDGRTKGRVLLVGEEGIGERILFASMVPDAIKAGATPVIEMTSGFERFSPWFRRSFPKLEIVGGGESVNIDYQCVIGDLGQFFRRRFEHFPRHKGYMTWDKKRAAAYRHRLSPGPVIGLCWKSISSAGPHKSIPLKALAPILNTPGATFVDIQYGSEEKECNEAAPLMHRLPDLDKVNDMDGVAALIGACDLVITASSVTAHMAGAMGKPVWTFIPVRSGRMWFWFTARTDSPWYPSMKLYRQKKTGTWDEPIAQVAKDLAEFVRE